MGTRRFSADQARGTLELVGRIVRDVVRDYRRLADRAERHRAIRDATETSPQGARELSLVRSEMTELSEGIDDYVAELREIGCEMKDPKKGIVDYPAWRDGRPIHLCWRLGEDRVEYWHDPREGCEARRPLFTELTVPGGA